MSYSIYLLHPIAASAASTYFAKTYQVPAAIALTLAVSWLGFQAVEQLFMRVGRSVVRFTRHRRRLGQV